MKFIVTKTRNGFDENGIEICPAKGCILEKGTWFLEIKDLEELLDFQDKYGEIIISKDPDGYTIEIYNYYRE